MLETPNGLLCTRLRNGSENHSSESIAGYESDNQQERLLNT